MFDYYFRLSLFFSNFCLENLTFIYPVLIIQKLLVKNKIKYQITGAFQTYKSVMVVPVPLSGYCPEVQLYGGLFSLSILEIIVKRLWGVGFYLRVRFSI